MLAAIMRQKLQNNIRCLYLNSIPMVAGMRSYLAAAGVDVVREAEDGSLTLSSALSHLVDGLYFDPSHMISTLETALDEALADGYDGLWATGDMTWELGPENDFSKLLEYEWRLEEFFRAHPQISGICQYHAETLPRSAVRTGLHSHPGLFVSETLSLMNPHYLHRAELPQENDPDQEVVDDFIDRLSSSGPAN
jgi:hypothetical protein